MSEVRLIDANALLNKAWDAENGFGWEKVISLNDVVNAPTIDPVKHGRWIYDGKRFESGNDWWHCSECGYSDVLNRHNLPNYCPNCGARMDGEKE